MQGILPMLKIAKLTLIFPALALVALLATGCGNFSINNLFGLKSATDRDFGDDEPQIMARDAQERMDADDYKSAVTLWRQLKDQYPYSRYAALAELKLGDALFLQGKYIEAMAAYEDFERLHPDNDAVAYAVYQQGMCQYMRMQGIDRDQTPTILAIQTFARLIDTFPTSQYATMAKARIAEAQHILAGHEFYVGEFYYKRKDYEAAINRFMGLLQYYPDSGYHQRSLNYIAEYQAKIASGAITAPGNLRGQEFDSPFIQSTGDAF
ncbi:MAG: outer membrane protein assembly factor BamD [Candidatus Adiutrix sp.]